MAKEISGVVGGPIGHAAGQAVPALVHAGSTAWKAISGNRPVLSMGNAADALPEGVPWRDVVWRGHAYVPLRYRRTRLRLPVVDVTLHHWWRFGIGPGGHGQYVKDAKCTGNGRGRFGETVEVEVTVGRPENAGADAAKPLAQLPLNVTILHSGTAIYVLSVRGDGGHRLERLSPDAEHVREESTRSSG